MAVKGMQVLRRNIAVRFSLIAKSRIKFTSVSVASVGPLGFSQPKPMRPPLMSFSSRASRINVSKMDELRRLGDAEEEGSSENQRPSMEKRADFQSICQFLPAIDCSSAVSWPPRAVEILTSISKGPNHSKLNSAEQFVVTITDLRKSLGLTSLHGDVSKGISMFFNDRMNKNEAQKWFREVVPRLADLMLKLPALLEAHYQNAGEIHGMETGLRLLDSQQSGIVVLSQELIAGLLVCALFCVFPTAKRTAKNLQPFNFDKLFTFLYKRNKENQEHKLKWLVHYFEKICTEMPQGNVSFERKVLSLEESRSNIVYPKFDFWSNSTIPLCPLQVHTSGKIEDHQSEALEIDFADPYIGGKTLEWGCVQEEIRFIINPELIISMLFLPKMSYNEAIEIVGAQRFSNYSGYNALFRFSGDYVDKKGVDETGRRRTRVVAIDALRKPGKTQYEPKGLLRETNKAFVGFFDREKCQMFEENAISGENLNDGEGGDIGVATGNWGCGAFGGDPEVKVFIQWLAASQGWRPFVSYYTFGSERLKKLEEVVKLIEAKNWSVGQLWNVLEDYSSQRQKGQTKAGLIKWLITSLL